MGNLFIGDWTVNGATGNDTQCHTDPATYACKTIEAALFFLAPGDTLSIEGFGGLYSILIYLKSVFFNIFDREKLLILTLSSHLQM
jgi:hypothetical protein